MRWVTETSPSALRYRRVCPHNFRGCHRPAASSLGFLSAEGRKDEPKKGHFPAAFLSDNSTNLVGEPMNSRSDAELVRSARNRDRDAYNELIRRHQKPIYTLACALIPDRYEAEDMTQEAFLRAWLNLDMLSDPEKFGPWLRRIIFGVSIDWLRTFRPNLYRVENSNVEPELLSQPTNNESADTRLERIELQKRVWDAVSRLPPHYRLPLTMFHFDGLSHSRVAEALGVSAGTARSLVTRARQKLRPVLSSYASEIFAVVEDVFDEQGTRQIPMLLLHIVDGESVAGTFRESSIPGEVLIYGDLLYEGPTPAGLTNGTWNEIRARFYSDAGYTSMEDARAMQLGWEHTLKRCLGAEEVVLWTDHRLTDQLILLRVLDWLSRKGPTAARTSLISVGRYPAIDNFITLGQLNSHQLASLADTRLGITDAQFSLAQMAWDAFCSPDPRHLEKVMESDTSSLPFLKNALHRHLQQFPSSENGLSRTEHEALSILHERATMSAVQLFIAVQRSEELLFMGDTSFYRLLIGMASGTHAVVEVPDTTDLKLGERNPVFESWTHSPVRITETGLRVLSGQDDYVRLNGIDRWLGGVHLAGTQAAWRWNKGALRLIAAL
jgi:RNA polymerase sigma factor (sigma-70 family)